MVISIDELKSRVDCGDVDDAVLTSTLEAIELTIRSYTHNNFQNRSVRFVAPSDGTQLEGVSPFLRVGDTIQITNSAVNDGLYTIEEIGADHITVNKDLFPVEHNRITKVEYPADVVQCAIDLFKWKMEFGSKVGIKSESETLSRHSESVTYEDSSNLFMGYPVGILNGLSLHMKARC